ncbi:MAG TPA: hypothetical protein VGH51_06910 [Candidatus Angelobacter sp.]|jgi:hypothetical protein
MLQLVLHLPPHSYQLVPMDQQLPQIALLLARYPQSGKPILQHQPQQQFGIPPVGLLFAYLRGPDPARIPKPQLMPQFGQ